MIAHANLSAARCLVLGAGGFIGTNLCAALAEAGAKVVGFGRRPRHAMPVEPADWHVGEFHDVAAIRAALDGATHVFHLLGGSNPSAHNADPSGEISANILPTLALLDACRDTAVQRVVFVSSGGAVYGPRAAVPTSETAPTDPISAYGIGKLIVEKYLAQYRHQYGLDYRILRVANPFGPFQMPGRSQGFIAQTLACALEDRPLQIWGDGSVVRDFVYIRDVVDAIVEAATHVGDDRVFNIGSGVARSLREVIEDVETVVGRAVRVEYRDARPADVPRSLLDCSCANRALGWQATADWTAALAETRDWLSRAE